MDIEEEAGRLEQEWEVVTSAPFSFIAVCLITVAIIYGFFWLLHNASFKNKDSTIETLRERLAWTEKQRDSFKSQVSEFQAEYDDVKDNSPVKLQEKALALVAEIRTFLEQARRESEAIMSRRWQEKPKETGESGRQRAWSEFTAALTNQSGETSMEFDRRFKVHAIVLRDELLSHLPEYSPERGVHYEHPTNPIGMGMVADDLERMARLIQI